MFEGIRILNFFDSHSSKYQPSSAIIYAIEIQTLLPKLLPIFLLVIYNYNIFVMSNFWKTMALISLLFLAIPYICVEAFNSEEYDIEGIYDECKSEQNFHNLTNALIQLFIKRKDCLT